MAFPFDSNDYLFPGLESILETVQNQFWWGRESQQKFLPPTISSVATDSSNTVTTVLRGGLLLGQITASGKLTTWSPTATNGAQEIYGVLVSPVSMLDAGAATDRYAFVMVGGNLLSDRLLIGGNAEEGIVGDAQEFNVSNQLNAKGFCMDRHHIYAASQQGQRQLNITAAVTITAAADHGRTFVLAGAGGGVTLAPPAPQKGLTYHFWNQDASNTLTIDPAGANTISIPGAPTATTAVLQFGESATIIGISATAYQLVNGTESTD